MENEKKEKKIYFSKEIDKQINSIAVTVSFIIIGLLLQFFPTFFGIPLITTIIEWAFIIVGFLAFGSSISKSQNIIVGFDKFFIGILLLCAWFALFTIYNNNWIVNIISFILLIMGVYSIILSLIQIVFSFVRYMKNKKSCKDNNENGGDILLFFTKLLSMLLIAAQVIKAIFEIKV